MGYSLENFKSANVLGGSGVLLGASVFANFSSSASRAMISPLVPLVTSDFGISNSDIGLALTGMWAVFALVQFPSGLLSDRFGERRVIILAMGFLLIGSGLLFLSPSFSFFFISVWFIGIGSGLYLISSTSLLTKNFVDVGGTLGIHNAGAAVGSAAVPPVIVYIAVRHGWRVSLTIGSILAIISILLFVNTNQKLKSGSNNSLFDGISIEKIKPLTHNHGLIFTTLMAACAYFVFQGTFTFLPTILVEHWSFNPGAASILFSSIFIMRAIIAPVLGYLSESRGRDYILGRSALIAGIGFLLLTYTTSKAVAVISIIFLGTGLSYAPVLTSRFMDKLGDDDRGVGFGLANTLANILGSLGSAVTGFVATSSGWPIAILLLSLLTFILIGSICANYILRLGW
jgi:MFS family permease